jgi:hypothetical protein
VSISERENFPSMIDVWPRLELGLSLVAEAEGEIPRPH